MVSVKHCRRKTKSARVSQGELGIAEKAKRLLLVWGAIGMLSLMAGCGGGGGSPTTYQIGGTLTGLQAGDAFLPVDEGNVVLQLNGKYDLTVSPAQSGQDFTFSQRLTAGAHYTVRIKQYPLNHLCDISNATGTVGGDVTDIAITCRETRLNDSGIDQWSNEVNNTLQTAQADYPGQDADDGRDAYQREAKLAKHGAGAAGFDFTKLAADGSELAGNAASWACVRDNVTGLIWRKEEPSQGQSWDAAVAYAAAAAPTCGVKTGKWRLPSVQELASIVDSGATSSGPAVDADYFPNIQAQQYWSATEYLGNPNDLSNAWYLDFGNGGAISWERKDNTWGVELVSGGADTIASTNRFVFKDGIVTDAQTGLMWLVTAPDSYTGVTWKDALAWAQKINQSADGKGYTDWRLPNRQELVTLVDYQQNNPAVYPVFTADPDDYVAAMSYWTSSPFTTAGMAWYVNFANGDVGPMSMSTKELAIFVRSH